MNPAYDNFHGIDRLDTPVQFFFDGLGGVAGWRGNKEVAALDPVIRFAGTAGGQKSSNGI